VFRVVLDQLRVSDGWVRCGRCSHVFDAGQALVDLDSGETRRLVFDAPQPTAVPGSTADEEQPTEAYETTAVIERGEPRLEGEAFAAEAPPLSPPTSDRAGEPSNEPATERSTEIPDERSPDPAYDPATDPGASAPVPTPSFLRRAERVQRWRQPRVVAVLAALSVLAALLLALQVVHAHRDQIAAHSPALRGALVFGCDMLGCSVGPPRAIDQISVESSGLVRVEKSNLYRVAVALRNRAGHDVALPAIEVAVSDGQGKLLARRVLRPAEMGASQVALGAGRDLLLQATLQIATEPVAGYTVELFYP